MTILNIFVEITDLQDKFELNKIESCESLQIVSGTLTQFHNIINR